MRTEQNRKQMLKIADALHGMTVLIGQENDDYHPYTVTHYEINHKDPSIELELKANNWLGDRLFIKIGV